MAFSPGRQIAAILGLFQFVASASDFKASDGLRFLHKWFRIAISHMDFNNFGLENDTSIYNHACSVRRRTGQGKMVTCASSDSSIVPVYVSRMLLYNFLD